jgi:hypothetical protein
VSWETLVAAHLQQALAAVVDLQLELHQVRFPVVAAEAQAEEVILEAHFTQVELVVGQTSLI